MSFFTSRLGVSLDLSVMVETAVTTSDEANHDALRLLSLCRGSLVSSFLTKACNSSLQPFWLFETRIYHLNLSEYSPDESEV